MEMERNGFCLNGMPYINQGLQRSCLHHDFLMRSKTWSIDIDSAEYAKMLDKEDPLRDFRNLFHYPKMKYFDEVNLNSLTNKDAECIYFCGHSLGLQLKSVDACLQNVLKNWEERGVDSHFRGHLPASSSDMPLKENMAYLVGAETEEIAVMNGLTVNIHIMLATFYQPIAERYKILMVENGFHSDLYAVKSHIRFRGYDPEDGIVFLKPKPGEYLLSPKDIISVIEREGKDIALIFLEGVHFYTGQLFDMKNITRAGHKQGCVVGFDLAHAAGNVKLQLHDWGVDFALWCTYKYLNCGAGSMAAVFVHNKYTKDSNSILPKLTGWWGLSNKKKFSLDREFEPAEGADRFKMSNPSPFLTAMILENLQVFKDAGIDRIQQKQRLLTGYLEYLIQKNFENLYDSETGKPMVKIITPNNPKRRGCQISLISSVPIGVFENLLKSKGVVCDIRKPSVLRVTPAPLYNTFTEVYQFVHILKETLENVDFDRSPEK